MLQKDLLLPYRTIEDNVALPLLINGEKKKAAREKVQPYFAGIRSGRDAEKVSGPALRRYAPEGRPSADVSVFTETGPFG